MGILKELKKKQEILETVQNSGEGDIDLYTMGQLSQEINVLKEKIEEYLLLLGEKIYESYRNKAGCEFSDEIIDVFSKLERLRERLVIKEKKLEKLTILYESKVIDSERMKELKEDLDRTDATIELYKISADSPFNGQKIRDLPIPRDVLIGAILRGDDVIIPDGDTTILEDDKLTLIGKKNSVIETLRVMLPNG